jgi:hypothetical protein
MRAELNRISAIWQTPLSPYSLDSQKDSFNQFVEIPRRSIVNSAQCNEWPKFIGGCESRSWDDSPKSEWSLSKSQNLFFTKEIWACNWEIKMRTNENSRSTADDGTTLRVFLAALLPSQNSGCQSQKILKKWNVLSVVPPLCFLCQSGLLNVVCWLSTVRRWSKVGAKSNYTRQWESDLCMKWERKWAASWVSEVSRKNKKRGVLSSQMIALHDNTKW